MLKFRQVIRPGEKGKDVKAVKIAYRRMGVIGSGGMAMTNRAGPAFGRVTRNFQRHHGLKVDGIYGKATHNHLARERRNGIHAFSAYAAMLYRTARLRHPVEPPAPKLSAQAAARKLKDFHAQGKLHDDSGRIMAQINLTAAGRPVWSAMGRYVHIDKRVLEALVELIEKGFHIGCFALCSDHHYDGPHGHSGGFAVDISSVNGISVVAPGGRANTLKCAEHLHHHMPTVLHPWQLICDGYGNMHDPAISALTIPGAAFYGYVTMSQHRNHIHLGYYD